MNTRFAFALALLAFLSLSLAACDSFGSDTVRLRVENASALDFSAVVVGPPSQEVTFGAVSAGSASTYREVDRATEIDNIEVVAEGEQYLILPLHDGYGDLLEPGRYTYILDIEESRLTIRLERD